MKAGTTIKFKTVDEYMTTVPENISATFEKLRETIKQAAPEAEEAISYNIPAFKFHGVLVLYAAFKNHIGFYPSPEVLEVFRDELSGYETSKGAVQLPFDKPLPLKLIKDMVKFKLEINLEKTRMKEKKKK